MNEKNEKQKPEKDFKVGAVRATIWKRTHDTRDGRKFVACRVVLDRIYKDTQGTWQKTNSYDLNDIPKAVMALERAYAHLTAQDDRGALHSDDEIAVEDAA
jgi:hypothetical protein